MIEIEHEKENRLIVVRASGVLSEQDYKTAVPEIEHALELSSGPVRMLLRLEDFRGWDAGALWEELKFDLRHRNDPGRVAVIGDSAVEEWATRLSAPFAKAELRFFRFAQEGAARNWLNGGPAA